MLTFAEAVAERIEGILGHLDSVALAGIDDAEIRHVSDGRRIEEAAAAAPVADAFARTEVDPIDRGLGIRGPGMVPAVGVQLAKKLRGADQATRTTVEDAVRRSMAAGYVGFMSVEGPSGIALADSFDPAEAWDFMVHNFRVRQLDRLGLPKELVGSIERFGEQALVDDLRAAGLLGWRTGRVDLAGRYYATAGGYLRAAQTEHRTAETQLYADVLGGERWPYEHYRLD
jgi:hypothetical protein